jgi:DNA-directed RNA polymerase specialized sigma24 family protein
MTAAAEYRADVWPARSRTGEVIDGRARDWPEPPPCGAQAVTPLDVRAALAQLTPEHRQVIVGMHFHGRSVAQLARSLRIPAEAVQSRAYYGLLQLRWVLSAACGDPARPMDAPQLPTT